MATVKRTEDDVVVAAVSVPHCYDFIRLMAPIVLLLSDATVDNVVALLEERNVYEAIV